MTEQASCCESTEGGFDHRRCRGDRGRCSAQRPWAATFGGNRPARPDRKKYPTRHARTAGRGDLRIGQCSQAVRQCRASRRTRSRTRDEDGRADRRAARADEGRVDEARPDGQLSRRGPAGAAADRARPAALERAADELRVGKGRDRERARSATRGSFRHLRSRSDRGCLDRPGPSGDHRRSANRTRARRCGQGAVSGRRHRDRVRPAQHRSPRSDSQAGLRRSGSNRDGRGDQESAQRRTGLLPRGHEPARLPRVLPRSPVLRRAGGDRFAFDGACAHHRTRRRPHVGRTPQLGSARARSRRRIHLPICVPQPLPVSGVQRRPAPRELSVPRRRQGDLPRLRAGQALHRR